MQKKTKKNGRVCSYRFLSSKRKGFVLKPFPRRRFKKKCLNVFLKTDSGLIGNLPQGTATVIARERMHSSFRTEEPAVADRTMLKTHNNLGVAPVHASDMDRFNPYQAPGGPVRAQLLLSSETYRVTWLHLQPGSTFSLHTHTSTLVTFML